MQITDDIYIDTSSLWTTMEGFEECLEVFKKKIYALDPEYMDDVANTLVLFPRDEFKGKRVIHNDIETICRYMMRVVEILDEGRYTIPEEDLC